MTFRTSDDKLYITGSITQASTVCLGTGPDGEIYIPLKDMLPMVDPDDIIIDGKKFNCLLKSPFVPNRYR